MSVCALCRKEFAPEVERCPTDGRRLVSREEYEASGRDGMLGACMAGRYTLLGRIGSGGMGTVYRAEQSPMNRPVALKVLRRELGRDAETVARFKREARTLSQLKHPNTVTIFDFGQTDDGLLFLAMELLEGEMLSSRIRRGGPIAPDIAVKTAMGVLRSLDEAHAAGIIHRDLKPDNIFLARVHGRPEEDEVVKVVDFGIAKIRDGDKVEGIDPVATQEGTVFGTPRYMSPEQAQGKTIDGRSDLYAVGVLLFHMITGSAPFTEDDAVVVMAHHIKTVPPPLREAAPTAPVSESLESLVADALAKDPNARPQTAAEFLSRLDVLLPEIKTARLSAVTLNPRNSQVSSRRSWWPAIAAAVVVFGVLTVAMARSLRRPAATPGPVASARLDGPRVATAAPRAEAPVVMEQGRAPTPPPAPVAAPPVVAAPSPAPAPSPVETVAPTAPAPAALVATRVPRAPHSRAWYRRHHRRHNVPAPDPVGTSTAAPTAPNQPTPTREPYRQWND